MTDRDVRAERPQDRWAALRRVRIAPLPTPAALAHARPTRLVRLTITTTRETNSHG